jgi:hypothetical protein
MWCALRRQCPNFFGYRYELLGLAYDNMIKDVVAASNRRRLTVTEDCAAVNPSPSTASCVPVQHIPEKPETHRRRCVYIKCVLSRLIFLISF